MGNSALKSHNDSQKHQDIVNAAKGQPAICVPLISATSDVLATANNNRALGLKNSTTSNPKVVSRSETVASYLGTSNSNAKVIEAEILWVIFTTICNNSFKFKYSSWLSF